MDHQLHVCTNDRLPFIIISLRAVSVYSNAGWLQLQCGNRDCEYPGTQNKTPAETKPKRVTSFIRSFDPYGEGHRDSSLTPWTLMFKDPSWQPVPLLYIAFCLQLTAPLSCFALAYGDGPLIFSSCNDVALIRHLFLG